MSVSQQQAASRLQRFCVLMAQWKRQWQMPPDKEVFLNIWAQARKEVP